MIGKRVDDIDAFMNRLEATDAFKGVLSRSEELTEQGMYRAVLNGRYKPGTV